MRIWAVLQWGAQIQGCWKRLGSSIEIPGQIERDSELLGWLCVQTQAEPQLKQRGAGGEQGGDGKPLRGFPKARCDAGRSWGRRSRAAPRSARTHAAHPVMQKASAPTARHDNTRTGGGTLRKNTSSTAAPQQQLVPSAAPPARGALQALPSPASSTRDQ